MLETGLQEFFIPYWVSFLLCLLFPFSAAIPSFWSRNIYSIPYQSYETVFYLTEFLLTDCLDAQKGFQTLNY